VSNVDEDAFRAKAHAWWFRAVPGVGLTMVRTVHYDPSRKQRFCSWQPSFLSPVINDQEWAGHDDVIAARREVERLRAGEQKFTAVEATARLAELFDTLDRAIASPAARPEELARYGALVAGRATAETRPALAITKARKDAWSHEAVKLARMIEFHAEGYRDAVDGYCDREQCIADVARCLWFAGWHRAAHHAHAHHELVGQALDAFAHPRIGRPTNPPPTYNMVLHRLLNADGFAPLSYGQVKNVRKRPPVA
jgi:hypothetical protein